MALLDEREMETLLTILDVRDARAFCQTAARDRGSPFRSRTANVTRVPSGKSVVRRRTSCSVLPANDANTRWRSDNTSTARQVGDTVGEGAKRLDVEPHGRVARPDEVAHIHLASLRFLHAPRRPGAPIREVHQL